MMWIAVTTVAELAAYFVGQASNALTRREQELELMRARAARSERLISLTTLAAGAAHELSTPLATIALASRELERTAALLDRTVSLDRTSGPAGMEVAGPGAAGVVRLAEDARLIRAEVDRCQAILDQMSGRAGGIAADDPEPVDVGALLAELAARLPGERASRLQVHVASTMPAIHVPRAGFSQTLLSLLNNAFDASTDHEAVAVTAETNDTGALRITIRDRGVTIDAAVLERAGEPFFTTKDPGRGLGLGLFLARVFAERCGGSLTLESGDGTTATLELPITAAAAANQWRAPL
jgi:two-component system sensor histidine kinase RegB